MSSTANRVIKNTIYLYAKMGITMFISLYTTRLILNSLGGSDFGIFNIIGGSIAMLGFLNAGMASATQRFMSYSEGEGNQEKQKSIFNISFIIHAVIALIVGLSLTGAGFIFFNGLLSIPEDRLSAATIVYGSLILSTMFSVMSVPYEAVINAHENMRYYALIGIVESLLKLSIAFACVYTIYDKLIVYGILMACIPFITLTIMRIYCHRNYQECTIKPRRYFDKTLLKEMLGFAGWNFVGTAAAMISNQGNAIVVNHFFGVLLNAAMGVVVQLQGMVGVLSANMAKALAPVIVKKAGNGDKESMRTWSIIGMRFGFLLLAVIALPLCVETNFVFTLWLKQVPEWTITFFRLAIAASLLEQMFGGLGSMLAAVGKNKEFNLYGTYVLIFYFVTCILILYIGGEPYWIYVLFIVKTIINSIIKVYYCKKYCDLSYSLVLSKIVFPLSLIALSTIAISCLPAIFLLESWGRFCLSVILGEITYSFVTWLLLDNEEKIVITNIISKLTNKINNYHVLNR